ncbi:hypothetical protein ACYJW8_12040 [Frateuria aurantia]
MAPQLIALPVVLAVELPADGAAWPATLSRDDAAELASLIATDLRQWLPGLEQARLAICGAWFDSVELLRPGFPVWATLDELARRVPRGHLENIVAFGSHEGRMPAPTLEPDPACAGGPMRLLPITILAEEALADSLSGALERELMNRGEAGATTADWLIRTLGAPLQHARYMSRNDLLALTCVQYENVNLGALWTLVEAALLTPYRPEQTLSARGLKLDYAEGRVEAERPSQWLARQSGDAGARRHALGGLVFELRQYAALLAAHALPLQLQQGRGGEGWLYEPLADAIPALGAPVLYGHQAPGLGMAVLTVAQPSGGQPHILAHGYPLSSQALLPLAMALAERYGCSPELQRLDGLLLDQDGHLTAPAAALH